MARPNVSLPRPVRRAALTGALVLGAFAAFAPSAHAATVHSMPHNASCTAPSVGPNPIDPTKVFGIPNQSSGSVSFVVDGATITFNGTTTGNPAATQNADFACTAPGTITGTAGSGTLTFPESPSGTYSCNAVTDPTSSAFMKPTLVVNGDGTDLFTGEIVCTASNNPAAPAIDLTVRQNVIGFGDKNGGAATPELGSGELLATGLVPALGIVLYRRRRQRRAGK